MSWVQQYDPFFNIAASACVAMLPLAILFYMLAVRRAKGHMAAALGLAGALCAAVGVWGMPVGLAVNATLYGMAMGLFPIIWIVLTAVWLYNMTVESGEFEIIKGSLCRLTDDRRLQALFIAFAFGAFLEGTAGFGTPVAITAAMLMGLGFSPVYAGGICLVANTAPVAFGALGIPVIVASQVSGLDVTMLSQYVGRQLPVFALVVPLWMTVVMCGFRRSMEVLPAIVVASVCFSGTQFLFAELHGPTLPDVMAAIVTIIGLLVATAVASALFVLAERRAREPLMALSLFKNRNFDISIVASSITMFVMIGVLTYLPTYFQIVDDLNATAAGYLVAPMNAAWFAASLLSGYLVNKLGTYKKLMVVSFAVLVAGMVGFIAVDQDPSAVVVGGLLAVMGFGVGLNFEILVLVVQNEFPASAVGTSCR